MPRRRRRRSTSSNSKTHPALVLLVCTLAFASIVAVAGGTRPHVATAGSRALLRRWEWLATAALRWLGIESISPTTSTTTPLRPGHKWDAYLPIPDDVVHLDEHEKARQIIAAEERQDREREEKGEGSFSAFSLPPSLMQQSGEKTTPSLSSTSSSSSVPWTARNESDVIPLLPKPVMWLLAEAENAVANASSQAASRLATAAALARINSVAYCSRNAVAAWNCTRCRDSFAGAFEVEATVYDEGWDLFAFAGFSKHLRAPVVAFRGTDSRSIYNWAENMRYWRSDLPLPVPGADGSLVHTGFYASWNSSKLAPALTAAAAALVERWPGKPLYVVGHSLGAALATVASVDLRARLEAMQRSEEKPYRPLDVRLVTFGSPRVGNDAFASFVRQATRLSVRLTHNRDIVPSVPPTWVGFHHVATEAWQVDIVDGGASGRRKGNKSNDNVIGVVGLCDASGEDPRCHNSVCYLGLCTSVADHLSYMGAPMLHSTGSRAKGGGEELDC